MNKTLLEHRATQAITITKNFNSYKVLCAVCNGSQRALSLWKTRRILENPRKILEKSKKILEKLHSQSIFPGYENQFNPISCCSAGSLY